MVASAGSNQSRLRGDVGAERRAQRLDARGVELGAGATLELGERARRRHAPSRYGRSAVIASNASATRMIRDSSGISSPRRPRDSRSRRGARGGGAPSRASSSSSAAATIAWPMRTWLLIAAASSGSSAPGFWRIRVRRRRSCRRRAAGPRAGAARSARRRGRAPAPIRTQSSETVSQWLRVPASLASTARASAVASSRWWRRVARSSGGSARLRRERRRSRRRSRRPDALRLVEREVGVADRACRRSRASVASAIPQLTADAGADAGDASRWKRWANV